MTPVTKQTYQRRRAKLLKFISALKPSELKMEKWVSESKAGCGTVCCVQGWLPVIFPRNFYWSRLRHLYTLITKVKGKDTNVIETMTEFLGFKNKDQWYKISMHNESPILRDVTKAQVIANIKKVFKNNPL